MELLSILLPPQGVVRVPKIPASGGTGPSGPSRLPTNAKAPLYELPRPSSQVTVPPRVRALEFVRRMRGASQPWLVRCEDESSYVVKFQNNPQHARVLANEMLASRLAQLVGLPVAPPAFVEVSGSLLGPILNWHSTSESAANPSCPAPSSARASPAFPAKHWWWIFSPTAFFAA